MDIKFKKDEPIWTYIVPTLPSAAKSMIVKGLNSFMGFDYAT